MRQDNDPLSPRTGNCRHQTTPNVLDEERTCRAGVRYSDVYTEHSPVWNKAPCDPRGRANGAVCDKLDLWTDEEVAEHDAEITRIVAETTEALATGKCTECGEELQRAGTVFRCPNGHMSGFACGPDDINEGQ